jgi:hypothetical protein
MIARWLSLVNVIVILFESVAWIASLVISWLIVSDHVAG